MKKGVASAREAAPGWRRDRSLSGDLLAQENEADRGRWQLLKARGCCCAVVLNGQGNNLLETRFIEQYGIQPARSQADAFVPSLQFCFPHSEKFRSYAPDTILAEPVVSCMDITATVLRPLLEDFE
ncbi:MAG TPA: hypothetical protein VHX20_01005 [Terracidiphilus sp.]|jgi:hypothetical protein|nr:hypothetical protein [Terracidiphilus sp.]